MTDSKMLSDEITDSGTVSYTHLYTAPAAIRKSGPDQGAIDYANSYQPDAVYELKGVDCDIARLDVERAISDMRKDQVLEQYQFFVGTNPDEVQPVSYTHLDELQKRGASIGVIWQDGRPFHSPCGIRMNLALPFSLVEEAMERLRKYVFV